MPDSIAYLLIGGFAASKAAAAIRQRDAQGRIVLLTYEDFPPYDRPPLSKQMIFEANASPDEAFSAPHEWYGENRVEVRTQTRVTKIDRTAHQVHLENGETLSYEKLLLAPGASAKRPDIPGAKFENVYVLRTLHDSQAIHAALGCADRAVVIGGSYLGLELASGCLKRRVDVTIIDHNKGPWSKFASPDLQKFIQTEYEKAGAKFLFGEKIEKIIGEDYALGVETSRGPVLGDLIIAATGAKLNVELAKDAGLDLDPTHGIIVSETLRTSDERIWVAGDCACFPDRTAGKVWHAEHYMNARWQGETAGANMAGEKTPYDRVPYFFSDFLDLHMVLRGDPAGGKSAKIVGDMESGEFVELYAKDGVVKMGVGIYRDEQKGDAISDALEKLIRAGATVDSVGTEAFAF